MKQEAWKAFVMKVINDYEKSKVLKKMTEVGVLIDMELVEVQKPVLPRKACYDSQHFINVLLWKKCPACKRSSLLIYDYD